VRYGMHKKTQGLSRLNFIDRLQDFKARSKTEVQYNSSILIRKQQECNHLQSGFAPPHATAHAAASPESAGFESSAAAVRSACNGPEPNRFAIAHCHHTPGPEKKISLSGFDYEIL
jgi:hypothetical protein